MKKSLRYSFLILTCLLGCPSLFAQDHPISESSAIVKASADIRFTVLTPRLIRLEWDSTRTFTDNATFVVVNRKLPVPKYTVAKRDGWIFIRTQVLELSYKMNSGKFTSANLKIKNLQTKDLSFEWKPGTVQQYNLKGTARTLDRFNGDVNNQGKKLELEEGILSKDGWYLIDDSKTFLFDKSEWPWVIPRDTNNQQDWYFMGYGQAYKAALSDYTKIAGKVPMPPRYAFGYWWSRYWSYSDNELRDVVSNFEKLAIPLDVLVIDMDWHLTDSIGTKPDEFGQRKWWTGWTWNKALFPEPEKFLKWTAEKKLKTTLNLHPASGIAPFESQYSEFAKRMDFDTTTRRNIPYEGSNKKFMTNLFNVVLRPFEKQGVDFWWLDWQQWLEDKKIPGLQNTWWLNYTFFTDMERNGNKRPLLYHRWGGLGNHRYQIGFSGDAVISWKSLDYQPYFTNTASNVLYGYWSHDIGGHTFGDQKKELDPELYTRWMQYGALSPIFRTHSAKNALLNKEIWNFKGEYFDAQLEAIRLRYSLAPYIYTMARKTYDTGISLCRPMYYDYPSKQEAYDFNKQYQFGDDILVAPIGAATVNGFSKIKVWLPEGNDWYEWATGTVLKGGQIVEREFSLDEYPIYVKAGAILPMYGQEVKNLESNPGLIKIGVFPGGYSKSKLYEDSGDNKDYKEKFAYTSLESEKLKDGSLKIIIGAAKGSFNGIKTKRSYQLALFGTQMPEHVSINGKEVRFELSEKVGDSFSYNGKELTTLVKINDVPTNKVLEVKIDFGKNAGVEVNDGMKEKLKRLSKATTALKYKNAAIVIPALVGDVEETNLKLEYNPKAFAQLVLRFKENYMRIPEVIKNLKLDKETEDWFLTYLRMNK